MRHRAPGGRVADVAFHEYLDLADLTCFLGGHGRDAHGQAAPGLTARFRRARAPCPGRTGAAARPPPPARGLPTQLSGRYLPLHHRVDLVGAPAVGLLRPLSAKAIRPVAVDGAQVRVHGGDDGGVGRGSSRSVDMFRRKREGNGKRTDGVLGGPRPLRNNAQGLQAASASAAFGELDQRRPALDRQLVVGGPFVPIGGVNHMAVSPLLER